MNRNQRRTPKQNGSGKGVGQANGHRQNKNNSPCTDKVTHAIGKGLRRK